MHQYYIYHQLLEVHDDSLQTSVRNTVLFERRIFVRKINLHCSSKR